MVTIPFAAGGVTAGDMIPDKSRPPFPLRFYLWGEGGHFRQSSIQPDKITEMHPLKIEFPRALCRLRRGGTTRGCNIVSQPPRGHKSNKAERSPDRGRSGATLIWGARLAAQRAEFSAGHSKTAQNFSIAFK